MLDGKGESMNPELLAILRCPKTGQQLRYEESAGEVEPESLLITQDWCHCYPIRNGIPCFVPQSNYADNFGMQWNHFRKTQLDSHSGYPISSERFWKATGWPPEAMKDKWVLDVGCGAGRFAEVALRVGANVVALDYSSAVDACHENLKNHPNLHVVQGDIYSLPFAPGSFDYVYSLGVLQHTPDVEAAFAALPPMVRPGGALCTDYYWKRFRTLMHAKYLFRPITRHVSQAKLFAFLEKSVPAMLATSRALARVPMVGRGLKRIVPVADYTGIFPLSEQQLHEWGLLDTFDMLAPTYDNPQTVATVRRWMENAGLVDVEVLHAAHLVARGRKPMMSAVNGT